MGFVKKDNFFVLLPTLLLVLVFHRFPLYWELKAAQAIITAKSCSTLDGWSPICPYLSFNLKPYSFAKHTV